MPAIKCTSQHLSQSYGAVRVSTSDTKNVLVLAMWTTVYVEPVQGLLPPIDTEPMLFVVTQLTGVLTSLSVGIDILT